VTAVALKLEPKAISLRDAGSALSKGRLTSVNLVTDALREAQLCQERHNSFSAVVPDYALEAAGRSDRKRAEGRAGRLEGLPIAVKDLIDTAAIETRYGSKAYLGHVPAADADVVAKLKHQGAIIIGKTTTHEFAWGVTTQSSFFGDTRNPYDPDRSPGGSSGGMAAAVAGGAVAAGLGTDTGGSVRIPAALCGVVGFKPTKGLWSSAGIFPLSPSLDHPGLIGRSVDDVALLAHGLGIDPACSAERIPRVSILSELASLPLSAQVRAPFEDALARLRSDVIVEPRPLAHIFEGAFDIFSTIVLAEAGVYHFGLSDRVKIADYEPETRSRLDIAKAVTIGSYADSQQRRRRFTAELERHMREIDFLILPTTPCTAPRRGESAITIGEWTGSVREALMTYTAPFNLAGLPAITLPLPVGAGELPAGLQIVSRGGEDAALLQFAYFVEELLRR
jgi:aspartyl-tRNA(Asn)/glutamyl-tRNA(Gln) amidotransferase subunit A